MKRIVIAAALATAFGLPAFAQPMEIVCDDFLGMDNAAQMEAIAAIQTETSEMDNQGGNLTADQIHERLAADCKSQPDALVVEVVKEME